MKILHREKLEQEQYAQDGYITVETTVIGGKNIPMAKYRVPKDERWYFNEIIFFELVDEETGAEMFCIGLGGLRKIKI